MKISGMLNKMETKLSNPVDYYLTFNEHKFYLNKWIGKTIDIRFHNEIYCIHCGKKTYKSFFDGYCYSCFSTLPQTDRDVLNPELCEAHLGISRDMKWSQENCLIDHIVYLSLTSELKVGVTRYTHLPSRWIDQGAESAIKLAVTPYRQLAGLIEVSLKKLLSDKTNWRKMLTGNAPDTIYLEQEKERIIPLVDPDFQQYLTGDNYVTHIHYPVQRYPDKVKSINLDKTVVLSGTLAGIKGQYLILQDGSVFNIRKHGGYKVTLIVDE